MSDKHLRGIFSNMAKPEKSPSIPGENITPEPTTQNLAGSAGRPRSILIPDDLWEKARDYKFAHRLDSINEVVRLALQKFFS